MAFHLQGSLALGQQTSTWQAVGDDTLPAGGNWSANGNWSDGVPNGADATAILKTVSGARTIRINLADLTLNRLEVSELPLSSYWTLASSAAANWLTFDGEDPHLSYTGTATKANVLLISSTIAGNHGLTISGEGRFVLSGTSNALTGGMTLKSSILYTPGGQAAIGSNTITFDTDSSGTLANWILTNTSHQSYSNNILLKSDGVLLGQGDRVATLSGVISESGASPRNLAYRTNGGIARFVVRGDNEYTGSTSIGSTSTTLSTVVRVEHDNALGRGAAAVEFTEKTTDIDALELAGGVTISNHALTLAGRGTDQAGSLRSVNGANRWSGAVSLGVRDTPTIGVDSGSTLLVDGVVSGSADGGLVKVGDGVLILSGDNVYTTGTEIKAGIVTAAHEFALGRSATDPEIGGAARLHSDAKLSVASEVRLRLSELNLSDGAELEFHLTDSFTATGITVEGDQFGAGTYLVSIRDGGGLTVGDYNLLNVQGVAQGSATFVLDAFDGFEGSLHWENGLLILHAQAIPEPRTVFLAGMALGMILLVRRRYGRYRRYGRHGKETLGL